MNIPKKMHFIWFQGFEDITCPLNVHRNMDAWCKQNPDWELVTWDENSLTIFIKEKFPNYYQCWKNLNGYMKKSDMARYLILQEYGGLYIDGDMVPYRKINDFLSDKEIYYQELFLRLDSFWPTYCEKHPRQKYAVPVDFNDYDIILIIENFRFETNPPPIGSSFLVSKKNEQSANFWKKLVDYMITYRESKILLSFGTHRFGLFMHEYRRQLKSLSNILMLPACYTLWDDSAYGHALDKDFIWAIHQFDSKWVDASLPDGKKWDI